MRTRTNKQPITDTRNPPRAYPSGPANTSAPATTKDTPSARTRARGCRARGLRAVVRRGRRQRIDRGARRRSRRGSPSSAGRALRRRPDPGRDRRAPGRIAQDDRHASRADPRGRREAAGGRLSACIGTPISWPRLERHASGPGDAAVAQHVAECAVCRACLDEITRDVVALPVLAAAETARRARWWWVALPAFAAAALALLLVWPRAPERAGNVALRKGGGEVTLGLVRERRGVLADDATTFAPGDRWKVVVACAPGRGTWVDVAVVEAGAP